MAAPTMAEPSAAELHDAATQYAELGYPVFPLPPGSKIPAPDSHGFKDATTDLETIDRWWSDGRPYNIGIATAGLLLLDVDPLPGPTPNPWLESLNGEADDLNAAPMSETRRKGRHFLFRQPAGTTVRNSAGRVAPKVDIRGDGGYMVAPPSYFKPKPGEESPDNPAGDYRWLPGRDIEPRDSLPVAPAWLIDRQAKRKEPAKPAGDGTIASGSRNATLCSMAGRLRASGFGQTAIDAALQAENVTSCNPPLDREEVQRIAASVSRYEPSDVPDDVEPVEFKRITSSELASGDYDVRYLMDGAMVAGQPLIVAGPHKSLKTTVLIDGAISLPTAKPWLGRFHVAEAARVLVMSGESGLATIQETAKRVAAAKGLELSDITGLVWSPDVPQFGNAAHGDALRRFLTDDEIEVVFIDPAYLAMPGADAGNLMVQGAMLREIANVCTDVGATLVIAHHTKRNTLTPKNEPIELSDIAWAGFAEFARQWWLLNRRERYAEGTGEHRLWLSLGGSAGHSSLWAVDASEGVRSDMSERHWEVGTENGWALMERERADDRAARDDERERRAEERRGEDRTKVWRALEGYPDGATATQLGSVVGLSNGRARAALDALVDSELVERTEVVRGNGRKYEGYRLLATASQEGSDAA